MMPGPSWSWAARRRFAPRCAGSAAPAGRTPASSRVARTAASTLPGSPASHARAANVRADVLHKATSDLAGRYETIVAEDLNVTGMLANRRLARAVAGQGFGTARRMLSYKAAWNGGQLVIAGRWYPSSKTCSACGWRKPSLTLAERIFTCEACGLVMDRDVNAAESARARR